MARLQPSRPAVICAQRPRRAGRGRLRAAQLRRTRGGERPPRARARGRRHPARHAHRADGAAEPGVLRAHLRAVQGGRGAGADRSGHRRAQPRRLPRGGAARSVHRHPQGARGARAARLGARQRAHQRHGRFEMVLGRPYARANCATRSRAGNAVSPQSNPRPTRPPPSSSPAAAPARPRAPSTRTGSSPRRWRTSAASTASSRARSTWRPFRCSRCSAPRSA